VDAHSTNELAVYAFLLGIPVVAVSYSPTGLHPWLTHCAQATVHSPESVQEILDVLTPATPNFACPETPCPPAEDTCLPEEDEFGPVTEQELGEPDVLGTRDANFDCDDNCDEHETCRED
jgi:hypothetical protein